MVHSSGVVLYAIWRRARSFWILAGARFPCSRVSVSISHLASVEPNVGRESLADGHGALPEGPTAPVQFGTVDPSAANMVCTVFVGAFPVLGVFSRLLPLCLRDSNPWLDPLLERTVALVVLQILSHAADLGSMETK